MNVAEKVRVAEQLDKLNVDIIEAGFPSLRKEILKRSGPFPERSNGLKWLPGQGQSSGY